MEISVEPASGTAKAVNACFPNSKTSEPVSAGPGALSGTVVSTDGTRKRTRARLLSSPRTRRQPQVTLATDKDTKVQVLRMWAALAPYDVEIQKHFEATRGRMAGAG